MPKVTMMLRAASGIALFLVSLYVQADNSWFSSAEDVTEADWRNPEDLENVWKSSWVNFPAGYGRDKKRTIKEVVADKDQPASKLPTVIFVHGCAGLLRGEWRRVEFFAANGYVVISPDSLVRNNYPKSCRVFPRKAFMFRGTLKLRQYDIAYVIQKAKALDWVDENNLFLVGHSEGAILAATFQHPTASVNARVAESWTCQSQWPEYRGVNAPETEPVLTLVSKNDPWFRAGNNKGSCEPFLNKTNGSQSMVYEDEVTGGKHKVLDFPEVKAHVLDFMKAHRR